MMVIDLFGLSAKEVRSQYPEVYQHLLRTVKPHRDANNRASYRDNWWLFGEPRRDLRPALSDLNRYIATVETAKHRIFQFLDSSILPDNMLVAIASDDSYHLGVLSSRVHTLWALRSGGWLGVDNDPRYSKSRCFDPFPFPNTSATTRRQIAKLADELDALRKNVLADNSKVTLTALYNVLEEIKGGLPLSEKSEDIRDCGHIHILKDLHEQIDTLVSEAYGWSIDISENDILTNLAALNEERSKEEARGLIRWLRPTYQIDKLGPLAHRADKVQEISVGIPSRAKHTFPQEPREQAGQILRLLRRSLKPLTAGEIAASFKEGEQIVADVLDILQSFNRLGDANSFDNGMSYVAQSA